jgi:DNA-binding transcriptional ArsR family regulator
VPGDADIPAIAAMLAEPARAQILALLSDGRALPAGELARLAHVAASTASTHLSRLLDAGLVAVEQHGRHRYFRLATPEIVRAMEALAVVAPPQPVRSLRDDRVGAALRFARTCYDHVAGRLGVEITSALLDQGALAPSPRGYELTPTCDRLLDPLGIDLDELRRGRRTFARPCLDWSERRHHLAGALGAAIARSMLDDGWVDRSRAGRALFVTDRGQAGLEGLLGIEVDAARASAVPAMRRLAGTAVG